MTRTMKGIIIMLIVLAVHVGAYADNDKAKGELRKLSDAFIGVAENARPAVVNISTESQITTGGNVPYREEDIFRYFFGDTPFTKRNRKRTVSSLGSGVIISNDGYILTNNHVIKNADKIDITLLDGRKFKAKVKGSDAMIDVALLKIEARGLPYAELGNSDKIAIGQWVVAIGNPFGLNFSVTAGIISALGRKGITESPLQQLIQTDAAINKGNSGGPLLDLDGRVIGINTAILSRTGGFDGIGFAVPVNLIKNILPQLKKTGQVQRGFLGIRMQSLDRSLKEGFQYKGKGGVLIAEVNRGGAADNAGLLRGDIIVKINDDQILDYQDAYVAISSHSPGDRIRIKIFRNGKYINLTARLTAKRSSQREIKSKNDEIGLKVQSLTDAVRSKYRIPRDINGVIVVSVEKGKFADRAGLKEGDVVLSIRDRKVVTMDDYLEALSRIKTGDGIMFYIYREGSKIYTYYSE
ncbi:Do family serine endopeptidase [bacterium]|nr:Do family serine endopeptidase [bacterium]